MSRLFAVASTVAAGAVASAAIFTGLAFAASPTVTFQGASLLGLPVLSCASKPDVTSAFIPAGGSVQVHNMTGHDADIYVNGSKAASLASKGSAPVTFPAGTWTVAIVPDCLLNLNDAGTVSVHAVAAVAPAAAQVATPAPPVKQAHPPAPAHSAAPPKAAASVPPRPATGDKTATYVRPSVGAIAPLKVTPSAVPTPSTGAAPAGAVDHAAAGGGAAALTDPDLDSLGLGDPIDIIAPPAPSAANPSKGADADVAVGRDVSLKSGTPRPNYLLVLLTTIGIVAVGAAAIRALIGGRTPRRAF